MCVRKRLYEVFLDCTAFSVQDEVQPIYKGARHKKSKQRSLLKPYHSTYARNRK